MQPQTLKSIRPEDVAFRPAIVAPTYNNAGTLLAVLRQVAALNLPMIVVNDGSTDATVEILQSLTDELHTGSPLPAAVLPLHVLRHQFNRGKAAALATGFAYADRSSFTHVVTIDTDGQHDAQQIPALLEAAARHPAALILGTRDPHSAGYPFASRFGRWFSNSLIRLESGINVRDSQCGLRVYPLELIARVPCRCGHFSFETEILTRCGWAHAQVIQTPVSCVYFPRETRVSHFRPVRDSARSLGMHSGLLIGAIPHWPKRFGHWMSPRRAWVDLRGRESARHEFSAGLAIGVFIALLPLYGIQSVVGLFAAKHLRLHPLSVLAGTQISLPIFSPFLIFASIAIGHLVLHGAWPTAEGWQTIRASMGTWHMWKSLLLEWSLGGAILGILLALATYGIARYLFRFAGSRDSVEIIESLNPISAEAPHREAGSPA